MLRPASLLWTASLPARLTQAAQEPRGPKAIFGIGLDHRPIRLRQGFEKHPKSSFPGGLPPEAEGVGWRRAVRQSLEVSLAEA